MNYNEYDLLQIQEHLVPGVPVLEYIDLNPKEQRLLVNIMPEPEPGVKICTSDCIFCQFGTKTQKEFEISKKYFSAKDLNEEFDNSVRNPKKIKDITLAGFGEHLINENFPEIIEVIRERFDSPLAVLTNGNMLYLEKVRKWLYGTDFIIPTLISGDDVTFKKVTRPHRNFKVEEIIKGMEDFNQKYEGQMILEVFFVEGFNTSDEELQMIVDAINQISPEVITLNTVLRTPGSPCTAVSADKMRFIKDFLSHKLHPEIGINSLI